MNWTASLLRNQLKKQKEAYESRLNLLTSASVDVQNYLELEEKIKFLESNLITANENLTKLKAETVSKEKDSVQALETKEQTIANLVKKITASKELVFNLRKEIRENQFYYQRSLRTSNQSLKEQLANTKKELVTKEKSLKQSRETVTNFTKDLQATQQELTQTTKELLETKELLSIYQKGVVERSSRSLSFFNTNPEQVIKLLPQHPTKLYYFFYSTEGEAELDLSSLASNLEDNCLFLGTFGNGKLKVNLSSEQAAGISLRTPRKVEELFQFSKQKLFITEATKLYKGNEPLELNKGKASAPQIPSQASTPAGTIYPEEEKKKKSRFGFGKKDK